MFKLPNGDTLPIDTHFILGAEQFGATWLRHSTPEDRAHRGITEVPDVVRADDRFYWDGDIKNPKDLDKVAAYMLGQCGASVRSLLAETDWKFTRAAEGVKPVSAETLKQRSGIREAQAIYENAVAACETVDDLVELGTFSHQA